MLVCEECGSSFAQVVHSNGIRFDLRGRKRCLACRPHRPLRAPRKPVHRPIQTRRCGQCGAQFPAKAVIGNSVRSLYRRRFCLSCSPFGAHNTSRLPPGALAPSELIEHRRKRRNAKTYRYQKKKRTELKAELIASRGGRCEECGYNAATAALEFHHRDAGSKEFQISYGGVSRKRLWDEAAKCDLLCANCHRLRHIGVPKDDEPKTVELRRERKRQAVRMLGGVCQGCRVEFPARLFEFHHLDARTKDFAISADGILRSLAKIEAELAKCVLLCANCHRETHAGLRSFTCDQAVGEALGSYRIDIWSCAALVPRPDLHTTPLC
jgi:hypothetical protein